MSRETNSWPCWGNKIRSTAKMLQRAAPVYSYQTLERLWADEQQQQQQPQKDRRCLADWCRKTRERTKNSICKKASVWWYSGFVQRLLALKPDLANMRLLESSTLNSLMYLSPFRDSLGNTHTSINSQSDPVRTPLLTSTLQHITHSSQSLYPLIYGCLIYRNIKPA